MPDEPDKPQPPPAKATAVQVEANDGAGTASVKTESLSASSVYVANEQTVNHFLSSGGSPVLTRKSFQEIVLKDFDSRIKNTLIDEPTNLAATAVLKQHRLVLLVGPPELGKATLAMRILRQAMENAPRDLLVHHGLDTDVTVSWPEITKKEGDYAQRGLVMKDVFGRGNRSLTRFGEQIDTGYVASLSTQLAASDTWIVLTSDAEHVPQRWRNLGLAAACFELNLPEPALLSIALDRELEHLAGALGRRVEDVTPLISAEDRERIVTTLTTLPRLLRFSQSQLPRIVAKEVSTEAALRSFAELQRWFLISLRDGAPGAFCFALAVLIGQANPRVRAVSWLSAFELAQAISEHLRPHIPQWADELRRPHFVVPDQDLLDAARLVVSEAPIEGRSGHHVTFADDAYVERLWDALLQSGRGLLSLLLPLLVRLSDAVGPVEVRAATAVALGRVGALDGGRVLFPLLRQRMTSDEWRHRVQVGDLLTGAFASGRAEHFQACLIHVKKVMTDLVGREGESPHIFTFMLAMRDLGVLDPELAVREIVGAVRECLEERFTNLEHMTHELNPLLRQLSAQMFDSKHEARRGEAELRDQVLRFWIGRILDARAQQLLEAAVYALAGLSRIRNPIAVCQEVDSHIRGAGALRGIVALLFFDGQGVFDRIDEQEPKRGQTTQHGRVVLTLIADLRLAALLARFVGACFTGLVALPALLAEALRQNILARIKAWARDGVRAEEGHNAVATLLIELRATALADPIDQMLRNDEEFLKQGSFMQELARDVLTRTRLRT